MNSIAGNLDKPAETAVIVVPEIRDYERINLKIIASLQSGYRRVELLGVEGQRLLVSGLSGDWRGLIVVQGRAGPDLGAGMNAPKLRVICQGDVADGLGHSLRAGHLQVMGNAGACAGYGQSGGVIVVEGDCGPRAGLNQTAGLLALLGRTGNLAGERRSGGTLAAFADQMGKHRDFASRGGRFLPLDREILEFDKLDPEDTAYLRARIEAIQATRSTSRKAWGAP